MLFNWLEVTYHILIPVWSRIASKIIALIIQLLKHILSIKILWLFLIFKCSWKGARYPQKIKNWPHAAVKKLDNTIQWINHYPVNNAIGFPETCPVDSDLSMDQIFHPWKTMIMKFPSPPPPRPTWKDKAAPRGMPKDGIRRYTMPPSSNRSVARYTYTHGKLSSVTG